VAVLVEAKILIIDDDQDILDTYSSILSDKYEVVTAKDGAEAIKKSSDIVFNIALIDIVLPDIDGTLLLEKLKSGFPKLRKIIITGHASVENAINALNRGADAFLIKPVTPDSLLKTIKDQLHGQQYDIQVIQEKLDEYFSSKLYEDRENMIVDIFEKIDVGAEVWEHRGGNNFTIVYSNAASERITGIPELEKRGKKVDKVYAQFKNYDFPKIMNYTLDSRVINKTWIRADLKGDEGRELLVRVVPLRGRYVAIIFEEAEELDEKIVQTEH
jgi:YesN/AraC family two-component response regulator